MNKGLIKLLIATILISTLVGVASAESLFSTGIYQNTYIQPRSLFAGAKAKTVGDIIRVHVSETIKVTDSQKLGTSKSSTTNTSMGNLLSFLFKGHNGLNNAVNGYTGDNQVANNAKTERQSAFTNEITTQVVQILPNGNLVIQGHKTLINSGETTNIILSGVVDPRLIDQTGSINSSQVSNLQLAVSGSGTVSRSNHEGVINKYIKYLF
jgi:flagellar L-ring protein precursor FlgH